jgi:hypothetical protein
MPRVARDSGWIAAGGLAAGALAAAVITVLGAQAAARAWYGFDLERPVSLGAGGLFATNARVALLAFAAAAAVSWWPRARYGLDALLLAVLALNAVLVGAALAAYGGPLLARIGAHSALELAAAAVAGAGYLDSRRQHTLQPVRLARCAVVVLALLAGGALLEAHGH